MFSHDECPPPTPGSRRRGGPVPLRVIWFELRDDLLDACSKTEPVQEVAGAGLESWPEPRVLCHRGDRRLERVLDANA